MTHGVSPDERIDLVYTWVDFNWPGYLDQLYHFSDAPADLNPERFRDPFSMLKYSLRSVQRYLPWIGRIHIVTARPQVPVWLNTYHPQIRIVHHDEFMPDRHLPTFNSNVIESYLHQIPGLSDDFLYLNDDFLAGRPVERLHFAENGKYRVYNWRFSDDIDYVFSFDWVNRIGLPLVEHSPLFLNKALVVDLIERRAEKFEATRRRKFRNVLDTALWKFYRENLLDHHKAKTTALRYRELTRNTIFHMAIDNITQNEHAFYQIRTRRPRFYCLNDDMGDAPQPETLAHFQAFLDEQLPDRSEFER